MVVMDKKGELFEERRKDTRRKTEVGVTEERRVKERRKKDINASDKRRS